MRAVAFSLLLAACATSETADVSQEPPPAMAPTPLAPSDAGVSLIPDAGVCAPDAGAAYPAPECPNPSLGCCVAGHAGRCAYGLHGPHDAGFAWFCERAP